MNLKQKVIITKNIKYKINNTEKNKVDIEKNLFTDFLSEYLYKKGFKHSLNKLNADYKNKAIEKDHFEKFALYKV